uniref:Uncharacterized protein n=1 Tax=Oryza nivara TaxID=4536 RepID=A0A0E0JC86_ORYNI
MDACSYGFGMISISDYYLGGGGGPSAAMQWQFPASKRQFGFDGRQQYAAAEQHGHREQGVDSYGVAAPHHFPSPSPRHAVQFSQANPSTLRGSVDERFPVFVLLAVSAVPEADGGRRRVRLPAGSPRRGGRRRQEAHRLPRQTGMIRAIIQCMPRKQNHGKTRLWTGMMH